ncbi:MAG: Tat pathway signal protein, partial [Rubrivivax sp.]
MTTTHPTGSSRRAFMARAGQLSLAGVATPWALNLAAMAEAAAQTASDYKALVCVFLYGGNDHGNTLPPYDTASHSAYSTIRGSLATQRASLAATALMPAVPLPGGRQMALAPELAPLKPLFDSGQLG